MKMMGRKVLTMQKRVQGEEHPDMLWTARNLARCLLDQGKHGESEVMGREVLAGWKQVLGEEHAGTMDRGAGRRRKVYSI